MSEPNNDWSPWGELWREQPAIDVQRLCREASRKRWRMRVFVTLELVASLMACGQCLRLAVMTTGRWQAWSVASLMLVLLLQALYLHARRGTWRASGQDVHSLVQLTLVRARAGIRLAWINLGGTLAWVAFTLAISAPELSPSRWEADARLKLVLVLQAAINGPIVLGTIALCLWYIRRQRRRIERAGSLE
jgi:hypothetical protein